MYFKKIYNFFKFYKQNKIVRLFALLGYKFNSYHSYTVFVSNLIDNKKIGIIGYNQFVSTQIKHPQNNLKIGLWKVDINLFDNSLIKSYQFYKNNKKKYVEVYLPIDLCDEYQEFIKLIGQPKKNLEGILNPSGRSIWVFDDQKQPQCIKIDTMQLSDRLFFSERVLLLKGVEHSIVMTNYLESENNIFSENNGGEIVFNINSVDGTPKRYTFLNREINFKKVDIKNSDYIIPVVALLSVNFWDNLKLVKSIGISKKVIDFIENDFAFCFAKLIEKSLKKTFVHYEVHQQNLSIHIRDGRGVKLIYHDLQDTVFDPVTYFLYHYNIDSNKNLNDLFHKTYNIQKNAMLNSHGQLISHNRKTKEEFTVTSVYRRYLRNFGTYNKILNYFHNLEGPKYDYYSDKTFEKKVLYYLNFQESDLDVNNINFLKQEDKIFLQNDLFWNINRFQQNFQKKFLNTFLNSSLLLKNKSIEKEKLISILASKKIFTSNGFSTHLHLVNIDLISVIFEVLDEKIYIVTYNCQNFLLLCF